MIIEDVANCRRILKEALAEASPVCFFTGAGISTESGIPDFRSPGGIWSQYRIIEYQEFITSEEARLEDWDRRFHMADLFSKAKPNAAHRLIADMINDGSAVGVVTQNIDGLHERSGIPDDKIVNFHGTGAYAHCLTCQERYEITDMEEEIKATGHAPQCACGGPIKAAVVSFGESVPEVFIERALSMVDSAKTVIAMGSSLQVWPAAGLLDRAIKNGAQLFIINREQTPFDQAAQLVFRTNIAEVSEI